MRAGQFFLAFGLCGLGAAGCARPAPEAASQDSQASAVIKAGSESLDLEGKPFDLWKGRESAKATVVIFTRTDCPISNRYAPSVRELCETFTSRGVDFFLAYVDPDESWEDVRKHLDEYQYTCPAVRDPSHKFAKACGVSVTPEAAVFDAQRRMAYRGRIDDRFNELGDERTEPTTHDLADAMEAVLAGRAVTPATTEAIGCLIGDLE